MSLEHAVEYEIGTQHVMAKGLLTVRGYYVQDNILYMNYTLDDGPTGYTNKYNNVVRNIKVWQKRHPTQTLENYLQINSSDTEIQLNRSLKFGVEIECLSPIPRRDLARKLQAAGISADDGGTHQVTSYWKVIYDGSIEPGAFYGAEVVSPPSTDFKELEKVCNILKEIGCKVNYSCGLHVHHEIADLKRKQIVRIYDFYNKYESAIHSILPASRTRNRYCKSIGRLMDRIHRCTTKESLLNEIAGEREYSYYQDNRYYTINLRSYLYYKTIEFRQHQGTIDFETIKNWVLFTHKIIDRAVEVGNEIQPLQSGLTPKEKLEAMLDEAHVRQTKIEKSFKDRFENKRRRRRVVAAA